MKKMFDCVEMKNEIQRNLRAEYAGVSDVDRRERMHKKLLADPVFGPILRHSIEQHNRVMEDAEHIAAATVEKVDLLVSWNFKHIVHFDKIRAYNGVNALRGYGSIDIRSPQEVITYD